MTLVGLSRLPLTMQLRSNRRQSHDVWPVLCFEPLQLSAPNPQLDCSIYAHMASLCNSRFA